MVSRARPSGIQAQRYRRLPSSPHDYRHNYWVSRHATSLLRNSSPDASVAEGEDVVDLEARPFPKVGDVVRYKGKWESEVSFGEVSSCPMSTSHVPPLLLVALRSVGRGPF